MEDLDELAKRQWGLVTHDQLLNLVSRHQFALMVSRKHIVRVHRGLYRMAGAPVTWQQQVVAVLLVLPSGVASYSTAARLHGLAVESDDLVNVTLPKVSVCERSKIRVHRSDVLDEHVVVRQRISCTSVERTIIDLASVLTRRQLAYLIDEAVIANKTSFLAIFKTVEACGSSGRKGMKTLRALLRERLPLAQGFDRAIELNVLKAAKKAKLQQPLTQFKVLTRFGPYFIDAAWPDLMVGAEGDGYTVHTASRKRHSADRRRRNELETLGWRILNFTYDMSVDEIASVLKRSGVKG